MAAAASAVDCRGTWWVIRPATAGGEVGELHLMRRLSVLLLGLILSLVMLPARVSADQPVVQGILFFSETCPHCHVIIDQFLPTMYAKYGNSIQIEKVSVSDPINLQVMEALDNLYGVQADQRGVPTLFIGRSVMVGEFSIKDNFAKVVDEGLKAGGIKMPPYAEVRAQVMATLATAQATMQAATPQPQLTPSGVSTGAAADVSAPPMYVVFLYKPGCNECSAAELALDAVAKQYPQMQIVRKSTVDDAAFAEWLGTHYGLPENEHLVGPSLFIGSDYLVGSDVTMSNIQALAAKYASTGAPPTWDGWEKDKALSEQSIIERFRRFSVLAVVGNGLIDGINPCAFATLVFLVSYLTLTGRSRSSILAAGSAFTLGVFVTYTLLGLGLFQVAAWLGRYPVVARLVYGVMGALCLVFAVLSVYDFFQARKGATSEMRLRLPTRFRKWVNQSIRDSMKPGTTVAVSLLTGVVVSGIELVCTGQVYLPTIMFVAGRPELRLHATAMLLLYNLAFIVPLVAVFGVTAYGTGSESLRGMISRHTATVKLLTALVFLVLAVSLLYVVFR